MSSYTARQRIGITTFFGRPGKDRADRSDVDRRTRLRCNLGTTFHTELELVIVSHQRVLTNGHAKKLCERYWLLADGTSLASVIGFGGKHSTSEKP